LETTSNDYSRADGFTMIGQVSATIAARFGNSRNNHEECVTQPVAVDVADCFVASNNQTTGFPTEVCAQPVPYDLFQITAPVNRQNRAPGDPCHTLARDNAAHAAVAFSPGNLARGAGASPNSEVAPTMKCGAGRGVDDQRTCVAHALRAEGFDASEDGTGRGTPLVPVAPTLTAHNDPSRSPQSAEVTQQVAAVHATTMTVRRLTPRECERLQGFPDDWTLIPWRKKPAEDCPDGPRYKALGNSMAVNVMAWIGERIDNYERTGNAVRTAE
jgi:hypothetical protein